MLWEDYKHTFMNLHRMGVKSVTLPDWGIDDLVYAYNVYYEGSTWLPKAKPLSYKDKIQIYGVDVKLDN